MTKLTKAQLVQQLEAAHVAYEKLAAQVASQQAVKPAPAAHKPHADCECGKCGGTGWFSESDQRICFACEGKGYQNDADQRRNWGYARFHRAAVPAAAARPAYVPKPATAEVLAMRERMAAAKAAAMAGGKAVLV